MDVVEVNEELGGGGTTVANVASFVGSALGKVTLPPRRGSLAKQGKE
jgi:arginase family enzyme